MANVYYNGLLIPAEDWDYELKQPKVMKEKTEEVELKEEPVSLA